MRNLFRTDDDSSEEGAEDSDSEAAVSANNNGCENGPVLFVTRHILNVTIEEQQVGGSIAHRLWPAALHLAEFVMKLQHPSNFSSDPIPSMEQRNDAARKRNAFNKLSAMLQQTEQAAVSEPSSCQLCILELGAGIGLTGLQLATVLPNTRVLLTDLDTALPLLQRNADLNQGSLAPNTTVQIQRLAWADSHDIAMALEWYHQCNAGDESSPVPLLILAADCVYWEELHMPLEKTLWALLSSCIGDVQNSTMCLMAGARRWKRDNTFYNQLLGKTTRSQSHTLCCTCLQETITRPNDANEATRNDENDNAHLDDHANETQQQQQQQRREVLRVYAVEWLPRL